MKAEALVGGNFSTAINLTYLKTGCPKKGKGKHSGLTPTNVGSQSSEPVLEGANLPCAGNEQNGVVLLGLVVVPCQLLKQPALRNQVGQDEPLGYHMTAILLTRLFPGRSFLRRLLIGGLSAGASDNGCGALLGPDCGGGATSGASSQTSWSASARMAIRSASVFKDVSTACRAGGKRTWH